MLKQFIWSLEDNGIGYVFLIGYPEVSYSKSIKKALVLVLFHDEYKLYVRWNNFLASISIFLLLNK